MPTLEAAPVAEYLEAGSEPGCHHVRLKGWRYVVIELERGVYWVVRSRFNDDGRQDDDHAAHKVQVVRNKTVSCDCPDHKYSRKPNNVCKHRQGVQEVVARW